MVGHGEIMSYHKPLYWKPNVKRAGGDLKTYFGEFGFVLMFKIYRQECLFLVSQTIGRKLILKQRTQ
jgi:hypothetical protein